MKNYLYLCASLSRLLLWTRYSACRSCCGWLSCIPSRRSPATSASSLACVPLVPVRIYGDCQFFADLFNALAVGSLSCAPSCCGLVILRLFSSAFSLVCVPSPVSRWLSLGFNWSGKLFAGQNPFISLVVGLLSCALLCRRMPCEVPRIFDFRRTATKGWFR